MRLGRWIWTLVHDLRTEAAYPPRILKLFWIVRKAFFPNRVAGSVRERIFWATRHINFSDYGPGSWAKTDSKTDTAIIDQVDVTIADYAHHDEGFSVK